MMEERDRWIVLIKQIRVDLGVGLYEAEKVALSRPEWRRWVERQINADAKCRKMALSHIKFYGTDALIRLDGERLRLV